VSESTSLLCDTYSASVESEREREGESGEREDDRVGGGKLKKMREAMSMALDHCFNTSFA
jgi:hypothetical protein